MCSPRTAQDERAPGRAVLLRLVLLLKAVHWHGRAFVATAATAAHVVVVTRGAHVVVVTTARDAGASRAAHVVVIARVFHAVVVTP